MQGTAAGPAGDGTCLGHHRGLWHCPRCRERLGLVFLAMKAVAVCVSSPCMSLWYVLGSLAVRVKWIIYGAQHLHRGFRGAESTSSLFSPSFCLVWLSCCITRGSCCSNRGSCFGRGDLSGVGRCWQRKGRSWVNRRASAEEGGLQAVVWSPAMSGRGSGGW